MPVLARLLPSTTAIFFSRIPLILLEHYLSPILGNGKRPAAFGKSFLQSPGNIH